MKHVQNSSHSSSCGLMAVHPIGRPLSLHQKMLRKNFVESDRLLQQQYINKTLGERIGRRASSPDMYPYTIVRVPGFLDIEDAHEYKRNTLIEAEDADDIYDYVAEDRFFRVPYPRKPFGIAQDRRSSATEFQ
jgi:hypothetical protein